MRCARTEWREQEIETHDTLNKRTKPSTLMQVLQAPVHWHPSLVSGRVAWTEAITKHAAKKIFILLESIVQGGINMQIIELGNKRVSYLNCELGPESEEGFV